MSPKPVVDPNGVYSRAETAHLLGISLTTLKQLIRSGQLLVSQPVGIRRVFIKGSCILEMLERTTIAPRMAAAFASPGYRTRSAQIGLGNSFTEIPWQQTAHSDSLALRSRRTERARHPASVLEVGKKTSRTRGGAIR